MFLKKPIGLYAKIGSALLCSTALIQPTLAETPIAPNSMAEQGAMYDKSIFASGQFITASVEEAFVEGDILCSAMGINIAECADSSMSETEMSTLRGGFGGVAFSVLFEGSIANRNGPASLPDGVDINYSDDSRVQLTGALGSFAGAQGIFQLTEVTGDNNIVNNAFTINVAIVNGTAPDALQSITSFLGGQ